MTFNKLFFIFLYRQWWFVVINLNAEFTALAEHFAFTRNQGNVTDRHSSLNAELAYFISAKAVSFVVNVDWTVL